MTRAYEQLEEENYMIGIPSRERSFLIEKDQGIWKYIDVKETLFPFWVAVRESETIKYNTTVMGKGAIYSPIIAVPDTSNIAQKRQRLLEKAIEDEKEYLFIIDDDVILYYRDDDLISKYASAIERYRELDMFNKTLLQSINLCSEKYPIVGLPLKQGSQALKYMFPINYPVIRFVCYHVPTLALEGINITDMKTTFMSDRYVQLSMLKRGYKSITNASFAVDDHGTGYRGGCSCTRTIKLQGEAAMKLVSLFPSETELKIKSDGEWKEERLDCKIYWKKFIPDGELSYLPYEEGLKIIGEQYDYDEQ